MALHTEAPVSDLLYLPDELILLILSLLDIPDLLSVSRVSNHLRYLSMDPILYMHRLRATWNLLDHYLPNRPSLASLQPPSSLILLPRTHAAALRLSRSLASIQLSRKLRRRPSASSLVFKGILPKECCAKDRTSGDIVWGVGLVAPGMVELKRKVERERVKDGLRGALDSIAKRIEVLGKRAERDSVNATGVSALVQRFAGFSVGVSGLTTNKAGGDRWGEAAKKVRRDDPTRAHVLGLRRFWETIGRRQKISV